MSEAISVSVKGVEEVQSTLRKILKDLGDMEEANQELASELARKASDLAPKVTGALASSIKGTVKGKVAQLSAGNESVPYAGVIEYGWPAKNIAEQSYLRAAATGTNVQEVYEKYIKSIVKKYNVD
jgi:hypothetical protein